MWLSPKPSAGLPTLTECEQCNGSGRMWLRVSAFSDQLKAHECDWCFGSGEIYNDERTPWEKVSATRAPALKGTS
jgi:DnaJ-class molecular chaperone